MKAPLMKNPDIITETESDSKRDGWNYKELTYSVTDNNCCLRTLKIQLELQLN